MLFFVSMWSNLKLIYFSTSRELHYFGQRGDRRQGIHVIRARGEAQKGEVCPADASPPSSYALGTLLVPDLI